MQKRYALVGIVITLLLFVLIAEPIKDSYSHSKNILSPQIHTFGFNGEQAYEHVKYQLSLPPRMPGTQSHQIVRDWIITQLELYGWDTEVQTDYYNGVKIYNLIANQGRNSPYVLIGAHYDSRYLADEEEDTDLHHLGVPGGNDGASGVAVLLELARSLPIHARENVWLVFFDAEDQGRIEGWDWIVGSQSFADNVDPLPEKVIIVDMIGDKDLEIYYESNSDALLREEIWGVAEQLGYQDHFIKQVKYSILDDHIPFIRKNIPSVDIIDFDYPYWHTLEDTADKVSAESLAVVGETLWTWVIDIQGQK